ncbi:CU044_5270 family protein [Streptomyces niveus]|uniref:CU044_5270 family protein n=1 Tax=Streptomyces niveus TaxID=193462 RepID=UPI00363C87AC
MDETTFVRELRADAPQPDRARLAPGRQRLLDAAASGGRVRRLRSDWRTAAIGAVAAITVAAVSVTLLVGGGNREAEASLLSGRAPVGSAKEVLLGAAALVGDDPVPTPGAEQWVYLRESTSHLKFGDDAGILIQDDPDGPPEVPASGGDTFLNAQGLDEEEKWVPFDEPAAFRGKSLDDHSASQLFGFLADLPDDPAQVVDKAVELYPDLPKSPASPDERAFRALSLVAVEQPVVHPEGLAKVYRAMAEIPGIRASRVIDAEGRETVAIGMKEPGSSPSYIRMYLLDPGTGLPLGQQWTAIADAPPPRMSDTDGAKAEADAGARASWKKGDVLMAELLLEKALVSRDRERP